MNMKRTVSPWWLLAAIPLVAIVFAYAAQYARHAIVGREFRMHVASLRQSGYPVDAASLLQHIRETTSDENTVAWLEWMRIGFEIQQASFSAGLSSSERGEFEIADSSLELPLLDALLQQSEPAYEKLRILLRNDDRVWLPLLFDVSDSEISPQGMVWANHSFMLHRMLGAVDEHNADAAVEAIATHAAALNAFDWQTSILAETQRTSMFEQRDKAIVEAIEQGLFNAQQLDRLEQIVGQQSNVRARWQNVIAAERAILLERIRLEGEHSGRGMPRVFAQREDRLHEKPIPVSFLQQIVMNLDWVMNAADDGMSGLQQRANAGAFALDSIMGSRLPNLSEPGWRDTLRDIVPNVDSFARWLIAREASRKITIEAIDRARMTVVSQKDTPQPKEKSTTK